MRVVEHCEASVWSTVVCLVAIACSLCNLVKDYLCSLNVLIFVCLLECILLFRRNTEANIIAVRESL